MQFEIVKRNCCHSLLSSNILQNVSFGFNSYSRCASVIPVAVTPVFPNRCPLQHHALLELYLPQQSFSSRHVTIASDSCVCIREWRYLLIWKQNTMTGVELRISDMNSVMPTKTHCVEIVCLLMWFGSVPVSIWPARRGCSSFGISRVLFSIGTYKAPGDIIKSVIKTHSS